MRERIIRIAAAGAAALVTFSIAASSMAQDAAPPAGGGKLPLRWVERPLTLPEKVLSPQADVQIAHFEAGPFFDVTNVAIEAGGSYGIMDDLTVEAHPLGLIVGDSDPDYTRFMVGATYRFLNGSVEVGGRFRLQLDNDAAFYLNPGLPVRIHAGDMIRMDTGINLVLIIPTSGADPVFGHAGINGEVLRGAPLGLPFAIFSVESGVPFDLSVQLMDQVFAGLTTGFGIADFSEAGDTVFLPLGLFAGGTIPGDDGPLVDIGGSFGFPFFITGGSDSNPNTELWSIGLTGRGYLSL